jgi:hypothetical protein
MFMLMKDRLVNMLVPMRADHAVDMLVSVVGAVVVDVIMHDAWMPVKMIMPLFQEDIGPQSHKRPGREDHEPRDLAQQRDGDQGADERAQGEERPRAGRT